MSSWIDSLIFIAIIKLMPQNNIITFINKSSMVMTCQISLLEERKVGEVAVECHELIGKINHI